MSTLNKSLVEKYLIKLKEDFLSTREDLNNFLRQEFKLVVDELPSYPGRYSWVIKYPSPRLVTKKIYLDFYADGNIVYDFVEKLTAKEQTSLDTSVDFLEPDMEPGVNNVINIGKPNGLDNLINKINNFINESSGSK